MKYFLLLFCSHLLSCTNSRTDSSAADTTETFRRLQDTFAVPIQANNKTCYAYQSPHDSIRLSLTQMGKNVSGTLFYAYAGKDKNSGTITGIMRGDTLLADYTFMSEGKTSVRQVTFLKISTGFVEGFGDSKMLGIKVIFKSTKTLKFTHSMVLQKLQCSAL